MRYCLGVDIGNFAVTAAVADSSGVETVGLGRQSPRMPALVHVTPDGTILTGDDAVRATDLEPTWTARLLCRRLDNPAPIQLGERTCEVTDLLSTVLWDVLDRVTTLRGAPPEHVVLTRPAALGPRGRDLLAAAAGRAGRPDATTTTAPLACGTWFAGAGRPGGRFAVYDFGGGAVETAVLRADAQGVELVGPPDGVPHLGGVELDELVREHLDTRLSGALSRWDPRTRDGARTRDRVLAACATAKETLSTEGVAEVILPLPSGTRRIRLHRGEIDALFRRPIADTVAALRRVLDAAGERPGVLVLTGGSARIPLVTSLIREAIGPGVRIEHAPAGAVAWGAAQLASKRAGAGTPGPAPVRPLTVPSPSGSPSDPRGSDPLRGDDAAGRSPSGRPHASSPGRSPVPAPNSAQASPSAGAPGAAASPARSSAHTNPQVRLPEGQQAPSDARSPAPASPQAGPPAPVARPRPGPSPVRRPGSASAPPAAGSRGGAPPARQGPGAPAAGRANPAAPAPEGVTEFVQPEQLTEFALPGEQMTEFVRTPPAPPPVAPPVGPRPPAAGPPPVAPPPAPWPLAAPSPPADPWPPAAEPLPPAPPPASPPPAAEPVVDQDSVPDGDTSWRNPSIGRPLAVALALLAVVVALAVILFVVLHRVGATPAGLVAPQSLVEALWTSLGPLF